MEYRIITQDVGTWRVPDNVWNKLRTIDIEAIRECLEGIERAVIIENEDGIWCNDCACIDEYNREHHPDCIVVKSRNLLAQLIKD